jgi:hypothetical protein
MADDSTTESSNNALVFSGRLYEEDVVLIQNYLGLLTIPRSVRWLGRFAFVLLITAAIWWPYKWDDLVRVSFIVAFATLGSYEIVSYENKLAARREYRKRQDD